jgi:hypothetical protein
LDGAGTEAASTRHAALEAARTQVEVALAEANTRVQEVLTHARLDSAEVMRQEAKISQGVRHAALTVNAIAESVFSPDTVTALAAAVIAGLKSASLTPQGAADLLRRLSRFLKDLGDLGDTAITLERRRIGAPEMTIATVSQGMPLDEAEVKLEALTQAVERQRAKAALVTSAGVAETVVSVTRTNGVGSLH